MPILDERHDFAHPVEPDTAWSESYYFNAYDPLTDAGLFTRIGVRPNQGTMDVGLSVWLPGSELATIHGVRPQHEMTDSDLAVAGVRYQRLRPMAEWRITCDAEASVRDRGGRRHARERRQGAPRAGGPLERLDRGRRRAPRARRGARQPRQVVGAAALGRTHHVALVLDQRRRRRALRRHPHRHRGGRPPPRLGVARRRGGEHPRVGRAHRARGRPPHARGHPRARHRQARARARAARRCSARGAGGARGGRPPHAHQRGARALDLRGPHRLRHRRVPPPARRGRPSGRAHRVRSCTMPEMHEITSGLQFPEGPVALDDGSVLVVEIKRGTLTRVARDGKQTIVAQTGGGPNGAAIGPDGLVYVCNNGGFEWHEVGGLLVPGNQAHDYAGGCIQRVDLATGKVEDLYSACDGRALRGPNDIVFDASGGFWFTDHGKMRERDRDRTGVFYARADGSRIREVIFPLDAPNGIGLSPDGRRLYVAETWTGRVWYWELAGPGEIVAAPGFGPGGGTLLAGLPGFQLFDSLAVDGAGNVCVATLVTGAITVISPGGEVIEQVPTGDPLTTNICFGGRELRTAYVTASGTGRLLATEWPRPGLRLAYQ